MEHIFSEAIDGPTAEVADEVRPRAQHLGQGRDRITATTFR